MTDVVLCSWSQALPGFSPGRGSAVLLWPLWWEHTTAGLRLGQELWGAGALPAFREGLYGSSSHPAVDWATGGGFVSLGVCQHWLVASWVGLREEYQEWLAPLTFKLLQLPYG